MTGNAAVLSTDGKYRYMLSRLLDVSNKRRAVFIMVNPSTADAVEDDATIRKVRGFSERAGFGSFDVVNVFGYRATEINDLKRVVDPYGPDNYAWIERSIIDATDIIYAWGPLAKLPPSLRSGWLRAHKLCTRDYNRAPLCLGIAKDGHPRHPLMVPYSQPLVPWSVPK